MDLSRPPKDSCFQRLPLVLIADGGLARRPPSRILSNHNTIRRGTECANRNTDEIEACTISEFLMRGPRFRWGRAMRGVVYDVLPDQYVLVFRWIDGDE